jgi:acyl carrier protein
MNRRRPTDDHSYGDNVTALTEEQIRAQVRAFVEAEFLYMRPGVVIGDDDSLMKKGVLDSMGVLEVMQFLADTFGVTPGDDEITEANLGSLNAIAAFVGRNRK